MTGGAEGAGPGESACLEGMTLVLLACISHPGANPVWQAGRSRLPAAAAARPDRIPADGKGMICHILYHDNCFDGACSAAVFMRFYASRIDPGARFRLFGMAHQPHQTFPDHLFQGDENAIVDFKYANHERLTWWFDHHYSAFLTPEDEAHFRSRHSDKKFLDPSFKSCTKLIATIAGSRFGFDSSVLEDLIHWADIVDGALYASAQAAVEVGEPAQKLAAVIEANKDTSFSHRIIRQLSRQPLNQVATQAEVLDLYRPLHQDHTENIRIIRQVSECSRGVTFFDLIPFGLEGYNKFIPYHLYPESDYHVSLMQPPERTKVSVGWNPWSRNRREHNLARICERYGGGGHPVVAAISLPPGQPERAREVAREIVAELQSQDT